MRNNLTDDGTLWLNMGDSYYNYRPGKGQALVKQTVANSKQDLPDKCARRGNKLDGLKEKRFNWNTLDACVCIKSRWMVFKAGYYMA